MRILFIQDSLGTGGAERSNAELWYYLRKHNFELRIVVLKHRKEGIENEILKEGFNVDFLENKLWKDIRALKKIISEFEPDIVHSTLFNSNLRARYARFSKKFFHIESLVNCPYTQYRFNDPKVNAKKLRLYKLLDSITQKFGVDHFHANGKTVAEHYKMNFDISDQRITIINRGRKQNIINKNALVELQTELGLNNCNKVIIINVARQEFQKAQEVVLKAISQSDLMREECLLLMVGRNGNLSDEINKIITESNLINVYQLGHREDVYSLLKISDIFVFPSRFEGFPGALIEAEAAGLPIVCSDIENNLEIVKEGENALIFKTDSVEDLKIKLEELVTNKSMRSLFSKNSQQIFSENYRIDGIHSQMLEFYRNIIPT
ncbi:MAG: glycosyltransferase family 4 protein [Christiangramia sp.]|uniref:glycosyltransferase family 4 protein n=1 Tax=Christiangramia sp. TaxID=1931228 RepID=UPI003241F1D3